VFLDITVSTPEAVASASQPFTFWSLPDVDGASLLET